MTCLTRRRWFKPDDCSRVADNVNSFSINCGGFDPLDSRNLFGREIAMISV